MQHSRLTTEKLVNKRVCVAKPDRLELYQVIIHCQDEAQQRELYERLRREGFPCRVVVL